MDEVRTNVWIGRFVLLLFMCIMEASKIPKRALCKLRGRLLAAAGGSLLVSYAVSEQPRQ